MTTRELGRTGIRVSPIGLGGAQFAREGLVAKFSYPRLEQSRVDEIVATALKNGITWFDTAELYGGAERSLGCALSRSAASADELTIATKWRPIGRTAKRIRTAFEHQQAALGSYPIGLYQIHLPFGSLSSREAQLQVMADLLREKKIRAVGVSNFSARQMEAAHAVLAEQGIELASNQVELSLLNRSVESNGILDTARRLGITLIAYLPLKSGLLTGKFHDDRTLVKNLSRLRRTAYVRDLDRTTPLIDGLRAVAADHSATVSQIALAWLTTHYGDTVVAIPGASKPQHAREAAGAMDVRLDVAECALLEGLSAQVA